MNKCHTTLIAEGFNSVHLPVFNFNIDGKINQWKITIIGSFMLDLYECCNDSIFSSFDFREKICVQG